MISNDFSSFNFYPTILLAHCYKITIKEVGSNNNMILQLKSTFTSLCPNKILLIPLKNTQNVIFLKKIGILILILKFEKLREIRQTLPPVNIRERGDHLLMGQVPSGVQRKFRRRESGPVGATGARM